MGTNPWTYIFLFAFGLLAAAVFFSFLSAWLVGIYATRYSKKLLGRLTKEIEDKLPGKNCGACGCENCQAFADALLHRDLTEKKCPYASETLEAEVDEIVARLNKLLEDPTPPKERRSFFNRIIGE